jgi:hypothetical protein
MKERDQYLRAADFFDNKGVLLADKVKVFCDMQLLKIS